MNNKIKLKWMIVNMHHHNLVKIEDISWMKRRGDYFTTITYCSPNLILDDEEREAFGKVWFYEEHKERDVIGCWEEGNEDYYNMTWNWNDEEREAFVKDRDEADKLMKKYKMEEKGTCYDYDDVLFSIEEKERIDQMYKDDTYWEEAKDNWIDYWLEGRGEDDVFAKLDKENRGWEDLFIEKWAGKINRMSDEMVDSIVKKNKEVKMPPKKGDMIKIFSYPGTAIVLEMLGEKSISVGMKVYVKGGIEEVRGWWGRKKGGYENNGYRIISRAG
tara:strand:- start:105 stop:923 length:819 start_codon:yes stop_codon:yes gene_type:complete